MCLSSAGGTDEENILSFFDKATCAEFSHHRSIDGMIEGKVKAFNGLARFGMSMGEQALEFPVAAGLELVVKDHRKELREVQLIALGFHEPDIKRFGNAGEFQRFELCLQLCHV
jgi:hypothetical protein